MIWLWAEASAIVLCSALIVASRPGKDSTLVAKAMADWKTWSAVSRGIESGIATFCADVGLTLDQLLGWANGRSAAVERVRGCLHPDARTDRRCESGTRRKLRCAWQGGNEP